MSSTPPNEQAYPAAPAPQQQTQSAKNGFGVAALILGIITLALAAVPFLNYVLIGTGIVGVILGVVGLLRKFRPHRAALVGLILSALGLILAIILVVVYTAVFFGVSKAVDDSNKAAATSHTVVYSVTGDSTDADVTYATDNNGQFGSEQATDQKLPFSKTISVKGSSKSFTFNDFTLSGTNGSTGTSITCKITLDGKTIATQTSTGAGATATCSGTN